MASEDSQSSSVYADFRFLLLGKTGSGKSTTGNTILGGNLFDSEFSFESVTDKCTFKRAQRIGKLIEIMDSPGLFDTKKKHEEVSAIVMQAVACMHPGPDAVLYVVKLGRYTEEEFGVYNRLKALLDDNVTNHMILLFTHGDHLKGKGLETMLDKSPDQLKIVLNECGRRYVVFDNNAADKDTQVDILLKKISEMQASNGNKPYTCPKYSEVGEKMKAEIARRMAEVEKREVESKKYVQQLRTQLDETKRKAEQEKIELQKESERREEEMRQKRQQMEEQIRNMQASEAEQREKMKALQEQQERERRELKEKMEAERKRQEEERQRQVREQEELLRKTMDEERKRMEEEKRRKVQMLKYEFARRDAVESRGGDCTIH